MEMVLTAPIGGLLDSVLLRANMRASFMYSGVLPCQYHSLNAECSFLSRRALLSLSLITEAVSRSVPVAFRPSLDIALSISTSVMGQKSDRWVAKTLSGMVGLGRPLLYNSAMYSWMLYSGCLLLSRIDCVEKVLAMHDLAETLEAFLRAVNRSFVSD